MLLFYLPSEANNVVRPIHTKPMPGPARSETFG
jgi:hypothetical protein